MGRIIRALVGGCKQRRPDIDAERLCGLEVNLAALCFSLAGHARATHSRDRKAAAGRRDVWASWRLVQSPHGMVR